MGLWLVWGLLLAGIRLLDWSSGHVFELGPVTWPYSEPDIRAEIPELGGVG